MPALPPRPAESAARYIAPPTGPPPSAAPTAAARAGPASGITPQMPPPPATAPASSCSRNVPLFSSTPNDIRYNEYCQDEVLKVPSLRIARLHFLPPVPATPFIARPRPQPRRIQIDADP